jgi:hypothetical protein
MKHKPTAAIKDFTDIKVNFISGNKNLAQDDAVILEIIRKAVDSIHLLSPVSNSPALGMPGVEPRNDLSYTRHYNTHEYRRRP